MKFTKASVAAAAANSGDKDQIIWDDAMPGFGIRVRNGRGSFLAQFRIGGRGSQQRRVSLGDVRKVDLDETKKEASRMFTDAAKLVDPTAARAKAEKAASKLFGSAIEDFISYQQARVASSYLDAVTTSLRERFKPLHALALDNIERSTVAVVLRDIAKKRGPTSADRRRAHLLKFFNWAIGEGLCAANPVDHTNLHAVNSAPRERVLKATEMKKVWNALEGDSFGRATKLLILTGQRRSEIGDLSWSEIGDDAVLHLPGERTKNGLPHDVPLSKLALSILKSCPAIEGRSYVFGNGKGSGGFSGWSKSKAELDERCGVKDWTLHDLRRTASTWMNEIDVAPHIVEAVLNHITGHKGGVAGTYNRAQYTQQKREALDLYAKHVASIVGPTKPGLKLAA